jgi:hypothetical protein
VPLFECIKLWNEEMSLIPSLRGTPPPFGTPPKQLSFCELGIDELVEGQKGKVSWECDTSNTFIRNAEILIE